MTRFWFVVFAAAIAGQGYTLCAFHGLWKLLPAYLLVYWTYRMRQEYERAVRRASHFVVGNLEPRHRAVSRETFGFSRWRWFVGGIEYHVRHLLWKVTR